jgi:response regulator NasT
MRWHGAASSLIVDADAEGAAGAIDITRNASPVPEPQGAFGRRAVIEQAKGILMARHAVDQDQAFELLRTHSQHNGRKLVDVAQAIVDSHLLLLPPLVATPLDGGGTSPAGAGITA